MDGSKIEVVLAKPVDKNDFSSRFGGKSGDKGEPGQPQLSPSSSSHSQNAAAAGQALSVSGGLQVILTPSPSSLSLVNVLCHCGMCVQFHLTFSFLPFLLLGHITLFFCFRL